MDKPKEGIDANMHSSAQTALGDYLAHLVPTNHSEKQSQTETLVQEEDNSFLVAKKLLEQASESDLSFTEALFGQTKDKASSLSVNSAINNQQSHEISNKDLSENAEIKDITETDTEDTLSQFERLDEQFCALLFKVADLTMAIPLVELGGIYKITKISPILGKSSKFIGILNINGENYQCIDTDRWLRPEKYGPNNASKLEYKFVIQLGKTPYALCCESVDTTIDLFKEEVKWRNEDDNKTCFSGLLKEKMCALLDSKKVLKQVL